MKTRYIKKTVEDWLNEVDYRFIGYMPTDEALLFVNFIKEVNGGAEENKTPIVHLKMADNVFNAERRCAILCHRGIGKTSLFAEYLILYVAAFGVFPGFGKTELMLYVTDSVENGVKNLRRNVEFRYSNSDFLQKLIPNKRLSLGSESGGYTSIHNFDENGGRKFTDIRLEFQNNKGHRLVVKGYGSQTGVRGAKELGKRPTIAILDDLVSDADAQSETIIKTIENTVYKAVSKALDPMKQKMVWLGTPFNARDPLYKAVESGAWQVSVYPICEEFPVPIENFRGSWEDRFSYNYVQMEYQEAITLGMPANFNQELMLRIMSSEDRLITDSDICWYKRSSLLLKKENFNYYITTDFATSAKDAADYSVISVWALNNKGFWFWVDGVCKKQTMDLNINELFRLVQYWKPQQVGIEISGQQSGFIAWIQQQMLEKNCFFNLASEHNSNNPGIRPISNKMVRFNIVVPWFKTHQVFFPEELKETPEMLECINELTLVSASGMKSKHDDFLDTISMLSSLQTFRPSEEAIMTKEKNEIWQWEEPVESCRLESYIV